MGTDLRKQYLVVAGHPLLSHTLHKFDGCTSVDQICLVVPSQDFEYCREHILPLACVTKPVHLVAGGSERQQSVSSGLRALDQEDGLVAIHDGVRPLADPPLIEACIRGAIENGACIPGIPITDTVKKTNRNGVITATVERKRLWFVQTPQVFDYRIIVEAHDRAQRDGFEGTDDASLVERLGHSVCIINGSKTNIKVTTEEDLIVAAALLTSFL